MNLDQIATKCFILALFIRDDGERLLLGDGYYDFSQKLQHFQGNTIANDIVELQGDNGQLLAGQVMRSGAQKFEGYIGDATTSRQTIEQKRSDFMAFFRIKHFYKVIYIFPDGTAIQRQRGYLTDAPTIPEIFQKFPEYSIALNFEDANYYEYAEGEFGNEIYAHIIELALSGNATGGLVWDAIGAITNGITWSNIQTAQGEYIQITNELSLEAPLASVEMLGNATQSGTPTPDVPVAVQTVTGEQTVKITGKNLLGVPELYYTGANWYNLAEGTTIPAQTTSTTATQTSNGFTINVATAWHGAIFLVPVTAGQTYHIKINASGTGCRSSLYWLDSDKKILRKGGVLNVNPLNLESNLAINSGEAYIALALGSNSVTTLSVTEPQLELGSTATAYEPYQGQSYTIDLDTIELAKIGNYQDRIYKDEGKWYIEKQVGKLNMSDITGWSYSGSGSLYALNFTALHNAKVDTALSNIFVHDWTAWAGVGKFGITSSGNLWIMTGDASVVVSNVNAWLSDKNAIMYYVLATPTTTEITNEALIAQLEALGASSLYIGVNNIGTETQNAMPTLKIEYYTEVDLDGAGYEWEPGGNTAKTIVTVAGVDSAWPIWTVQGGAQNPTLTNITTGQTITWQGFVPAGQTLTINMAEMTADLAGANVFEYITGEWLRLAPGNNTLVYNAGNADKPSTLSWNGVLA